ncbi:MAG: hypothetical protein MHM6MM_001527 [Cercozoa sp. M6MM]
MRIPVFWVLIQLIVVLCFHRAISGQEVEERNDVSANVNDQYEHTTGQNKIVVIGDLHGDLQSARHVLRMAGVLNAESQKIELEGDWPLVGQTNSDFWVGGDMVLVSLGDLFDRGDDSIEITELLRRLQMQAETSGGKVVVILGNHEIMNLSGDWRYVSQAEIQRAGGVRGRAMRLLSEGDLGRWLRDQRIAYIAGDALLAHAGIEPEIAAKASIRDMNIEAKSILQQMQYSWTPQDLQKVDPKGLLGLNGVTWTRTFFAAWRDAAGTTEAMCHTVRRTLDIVNKRRDNKSKVNRMIIGHNVQQDGKVRIDCDGTLLSVDVAMSSAYGGLGLAAAVLQKNPDSDNKSQDKWDVQVITPCHEDSLLEGDARSQLQHKFGCVAKNIPEASAVTQNDSDELVHEEL